MHVVLHFLPDVWAGIISRTKDITRQKVLNCQEKSISANTGNFCLLLPIHGVWFASEDGTPRPRRRLKNMSEQTNSAQSTPLSVSKSTAIFGIAVIVTLLVGCLALLIAG